VKQIKPTVGVTLTAQMLVDGKACERGINGMRRLLPAEISVVPEENLYLADAALTQRFKSLHTHSSAQERAAAIHINALFHARDVMMFMPVPWAPHANLSRYSADEYVIHDLDRYLPMRFFEQYGSFDRYADPDSGQGPWLLAQALAWWAQDVLLYRLEQDLAKLKKNSTPHRAMSPYR